MADIEDLIPDRDVDKNIEADNIVKAVLADEEQKAGRKLNLAEIARIRKREITSANNMAKYNNEFKSDFIKQDIELNADKRKEALAKAKADSPVIYANTKDIVLPGTTKYDVTKLLSSLNINLDVRLTKTDTYNLVATLLTCNQKQLEALQNNARVPVAIKTVITRLLADANTGNIAVIERLWDRIFGSAGKMDITPPEGYQGLLSNQPISREAYVLIRETFIGKD